MEKTIQIYDWHIRHLVALVQAFIRHHQDPSVFNCPDLDLAQAVWERANDFNVETHAERGQVYYGLWSKFRKVWLAQDYDLIVHSMSLPLILATCQAVNGSQPEGHFPDWQVKIIGDDGLPVDLPKD